MAKLVIWTIEFRRGNGRVASFFDVDLFSSKVRVEAVLAYLDVVLSQLPIAVWWVFFIRLSRLELGVPGHVDQ